MVGNFYQISTFLSTISRSGNLSQKSHFFNKAPQKGCLFTLPHQGLGGLAIQKSFLWKNGSLFAVSLPVAPLIIALVISPSASHKAKVGFQMDMGCHGLQHTTKHCSITHDLCSDDLETQQYSCPSGRHTPCSSCVPLYFKLHLLILSCDSRPNWRALLDSYHSLQHRETIDMCSLLSLRQQTGRPKLSARYTVILGTLPALQNRRYCEYYESEKSRNGNKSRKQYEKSGKMLHFNPWNIDCVSDHTLPRRSRHPAAAAPFTITPSYTIIYTKQKQKATGPLAAPNARRTPSTCCGATHSLSRKQQQQNINQHCYGKPRLPG